MFDTNDINNNKKKLNKFRNILQLNVTTGQKTSERLYYNIYYFNLACTFFIVKFVQLA